MDLEIKDNKTRSTKTNTNKINKTQQSNKTIENKKEPKTRITKTFGTGKGRLTWIPRHREGDKETEAKNDR